MTKGANRFERALYLALVAHTGQVDKAGGPYIKHVLRVASHFDSEFFGVVALLHDVVEDAGFELGFIEHEFGPEVSEAVGLLTRPECVPYMNYVEALRGNLASVAVKIEDLRDHLRRPGVLSGVQIQRYEKALALLLR